MNISHSLAVMLQIMRRDFNVFAHRIKSYGINYLIIYPLLAIIAFGYIQPGIFFGPGHAKTSVVLLIGSNCVNMLSLAIILISPFLFDLEAERYVDYQICLLPPQLLLLEMILFPALLINLISLPFFPLAYALLPGYFSALNTDWLALLSVVFFTSLCLSAYVMLAFCIITKISGMRLFWLRFNWPLIVLGGLWIPWALLKSYSPILGFIALLDPFTYITEGIRSALIGSNDFIPAYTCILALIAFTIFFTILASYFFKKKLDHI